jgi:hypothetical protein
MRIHGQQSLPEPLIYQKPYFHPIWISELEKCTKNGGYKRFYRRNYWSHNELKYFDFKTGIFGGIPNLINLSSICSIKNINYFPEMIEPNNTSKYTFKVRKNRTKKSDLVSGFAFNFSGSNNFQHFIQDCFPILAASKEFLIKNPEIPILIPEFQGESKVRSRMLEILGIKNKIIETNFDYISIDQLYFWNFEPYPAKYSLPDIFYSLLQSELNYVYSKKKNSKLILITRRENYRNFANEDEIIRNCEIISKKLGLELVVINSAEASFEDWARQLPEAKVVIGMHGGALFNLIFTKPGTLLFEFVSTFGTDSVINTLPKLGIRVVPVPIQFIKNQKSSIQIPSEVFDEILKIVSLLEVS